MKLLKISPNKKMAQIGENLKEAKFYYIPDELQIEITKININDDVSILTERKGGAFYLTALQKGNVVITQPQIIAVKVEEKKDTSNLNNTQTHVGTQTKTWSKSPEEQNTIKRQAIGHMTSRALIALQGQVSTVNIIGLIDDLYKKFQEKVG